MLRVFTAPYRYVQGPGALDALGDVLELGGARVLALVDELVADLIGPPLRRSLKSADVSYEFVRTSGEVTADRIALLAEAAGRFRPTLVIAAGGGKTLDSGKGVARSLGCPVVTVPTIASNDGPTSRTIATYDDEHRLIATPQLAVNPYAVVVDTAVIANAPAVFLRSGIGDALAKRFEADACSRGSGVTSNGTRPLLLPQAIADRCYDVLLRDSSAALADVASHSPTPALENVIEAVVLMSGLAFENGGLSLAHSMTRGLMRVPGAAGKLHGFHVAYGLVVQLMHEGSSSYGEVRSFLQDVGLPVTLADLDAEVSDLTMADVAAGTLSAPHLANCVPQPTEDSLVEAIRRVESAALL